MGLLQKLKSLFGSDQSAQPSQGGEPDVTVEREPSAESEHAVKGTGGADQGTTGQQVEESTEQAADTGTDEEATESETDAETTDEDSETAEGPSLDEIKGIGPTYADRLSEAGYDSVADLAEADAEAVAEAAQTGEGRASDWIERARNF